MDELTDQAARKEDRNARPGTECKALIREIWPKVGVEGHIDEVLEFVRSLA